MRLEKCVQNYIYAIDPRGCSINYNCEYDSEEDYINAMKEQSKLNTFKFILNKIKELKGSRFRSIMKILEDVTDKYYNMLNSFRADTTVKIREIKDNEIAFHKSFFDIEKDLIRENNVHFMEDIELLNEFIKIVRVEREE